MKKALTVLVLCLLGACGRDSTPPSDAGTPPGDASDAGHEKAPDVSSATDADTEDDAEDGAAPDAAVPEGTPVATTSGPVLGVSQNGVDRYLGIPYAAPPTGDLRFRPPRAHEGWTEPLMADSLGAACPQRELNGVAIFGSEDCLTINVWAPNDAENLPVMFWIHGGAFVQGSSNLPLYDGTDLARRGVVLVSINYRLGPMGFLAMEELAVESGEDSAGNYGLQDQVFALRWVRDNIAAFGGNPDDVTIFGESAGGVSVCAHLGSPMSEGLFHRAVIQSGGGCYGLPGLRTSTAQAPAAVDVGDEFADAVGCSGENRLQCLRDADADALVAAQFTLDSNPLGLPPFGPNIDGAVMTDDTWNLFEAGTANDVPIIVGSNADEANIFTLAVQVPGALTYEALVRNLFGEAADEVLEIYPVSDFPTAKAAFNALVSDVTFICPALSFAGVSSGGAASTYTYHFMRVLPGAEFLGAFHTLELFYVFDEFDSLPNYTPNADDHELSETMQQTWASFAVEGAPSMTPMWPAFDPALPAIQTFDVEPTTTDEIRDGRCAELAEIGLIP